MIAGAYDHGAGAFGLAVLHAGDRQFLQAFFIDQYIDHQPRFVKVEVIKFNAGLRTHGAGRAVATNHVTGFDSLFMAFAVAQLQRCKLSILAQGQQFHAQLNRDGRHRRGFRAQDTFDGWLGEYV